MSINGVKVADGGVVTEEPSEYQRGTAVVAGVGEVAVATLVAVSVAVAALAGFSASAWPAHDSPVMRVVTTVGQVAAIGLAGVAIVLVRRGRRIGRVLSWVSLSALVSVTLGWPLAGTKLYLLGVSVDQEFRTEYLTRLTDSAALHDMTYADTPAFYSPGWFWIGGRVGALLGMPGWEVFKPYAIVVLAVSAVLAAVWWSRLVRPDVAIVATVATTLVVLQMGSPEPYSAAIAMLFAPALVAVWNALYRPGGETRSGRAGSGSGWPVTIAAGVFLGVEGTFYTLYFAVTAAIVAVMAVVAAWSALRSGGGIRAVRPVAVRLVAVGAIAGVLCLLVYLPYLLRLRHAATATSGTAFHYLPESGAVLAFPMLRFSLLGVVCLIGLVWLIVRADSSRPAQAIGLGVLTIYLWSLASMAVTALGSTLLGFRLEPLLTVLFTAAGVFGSVEAVRALSGPLTNPRGARIVAAMAAMVCAVVFAHDIPQVLRNEIGVAYSDTDGDGNHGGQPATGDTAQYPLIDQAIEALRPGPRRDTVVLTGDTSLLSFYPYYGFQARSPHYANPLGDYTARAAAITAWSKATTTDELISALEESPWRAPDVFVFRSTGSDYTLRLAEDVYPNDPNVRRYTASFPQRLFDDPRFTIRRIGPFTLVARTH